MRVCATCAYSRPSPYADDACGDDEDTAPAQGGVTLTMLYDDGTTVVAEADDDATRSDAIFCHRHPPAAILGAMDCFPAVSPGEWCGEWAAAEAPGDTHSYHTTTDTDPYRPFITPDTDTEGSS
jgi:hypothetical protein